jgi:hypothetical protein
MRSFQEYGLLPSNQPVNVPEFTSAETIAGIQRDRFEPELCLASVPLDMHMRRLMAVSGVEERAIWARTQNCWHEQIWGFLPPIPSNLWQRPKLLRGYSGNRRSRLSSFVRTGLA